MDAKNEMENSSANSHNDVSKHHRKRGIRAVLAEVQATGTGESAASNMTPGKLPRDNSQKAVTAREEKKKANDGDQTEQNKQTLNTLLQNRNDDATDCLSIFVERNLTTETQRAMAIHAFLKAYNIGMGILNAAELSVDIVGVCSKSVRNWATEFLEATQKCRMEQELIQDLMSSARGCHSKTISVFACSEFQKEAREYVRMNANVKGSPNMTCKSFAAWVAESWGHEIHEETARQ